MKINKFMLLISILSLAGTAAVYSRLPANIPSHWDIQGNIDNYMPRQNAFFLALLPLGVYLLTIILPKIDPRRSAFAKHGKGYSIMMLVTFLFLTGIYWVSILVALGYSIDVSFVVKLSMGVLFAVMGNYMSQIRFNYTYGIRTPWTLASKEVWTRTHRVGGYAFVLCGILIIPLAFVKGTFASWLSFALILGAAFFGTLYSYLVYRKLAGK